MEHQERCIVVFDCSLDKSSPRFGLIRFMVDDPKIAKLTYGWRVRVRCPRCGNIEEGVVCGYTLRQDWNADADEYEAGEITEILPPDSKFEDMLKKRRQEFHPMR